MLGVAVLAAISGQASTELHRTGGADAVGQLRQLALVEKAEAADCLLDFYPFIPRKLRPVAPAADPQPFLGTFAARPQHRYRSTGMGVQQPADETYRPIRIRMYLQLHEAAFSGGITAKRQYYPVLGPARPLEEQLKEVAKLFAHNVPPQGLPNNYGRVEIVTAVGGREAGPGTAHRNEKIVGVDLIADGLHLFSRRAAGSEGRVRDYFDQQRAAWGAPRSAPPWHAVSVL